MQDVNWSRGEIELRVRRWSKGRTSMRTEDVVELILSIIGEKEKASSMCSTEMAAYDAEKCRWLAKVASDPRFIAAIQTATLSSKNTNDIYRWTSEQAATQCLMNSTKKIIPPPPKPPPASIPQLNPKLGSKDSNLSTILPIKKRKMSDRSCPGDDSVSGIVKKTKKKEHKKTKKKTTESMTSHNVEESEVQLFEPEWFQDESSCTAVNNDKVRFVENNTNNDDAETDMFFSTMKTGDIKFLEDPAQLSQPEALDDELCVGNMISLKGEPAPLSHLKPRNMARGVLLDHPSVCTIPTTVQHPSLDVNWQINPNLYTTEEIDSSFGWSFLLRNDEASVDTLPAFPHADEDKKPLAVIEKYASVSRPELLQRARAKASLLSFSSITTHVSGDVEPIEDSEEGEEGNSKMKSFRCVFRDPPALSSTGVELPIS